MKHKHHQPAQSWTERTQSAEYAPAAADVADLPSFPRQSYQNPHTSMGAAHGLGVAGHIVHMAGVFIPVVAGELVQDATKYKKVVRLASIGTAMAYEALWTWKQHKREQEREQKLAECRSRE